MAATTLTTQELDTLIDDIATILYGPERDETDGYGWLDPLYDFVEPLLEHGVAPNARDLADALRFEWERQEETERGDRFAADMAEAAALYRPETDALARFGRAAITQTGGMCLALEVYLTPDNDGPQLLVTAAEDSLPWERSGEAGWAACHVPTSAALWEGAMEEQQTFATTPDGTVAGLLALVERVLATAGYTGR